jgi:tRNA (mo5U34)-methyltransferase
MAGDKFPMSDLEQKIRELAPWFHTFIIDGINTKPEVSHPWSSHYPANLWAMIERLIPFHLEGKRVLDIGCNAGYISFELAKMGAKVTAVDLQQNMSLDGVRGFKVIEQAEFLEREVFKLGVEIREQDFLEMTEREHFDLVLFCGVYYHMPEHRKAFPAIRELLKMGGVVITESAVGDHPRAYSGAGGDIYNGDSTNYFVPSQSYILEDLLESKLLNCNWQKYLFDSRILITSVKAIR